MICEFEGGYDFWDREFVNFRLCWRFLWNLVGLNLSFARNGVLRRKGEGGVSSRFLGGLLPLVAMMKPSDSWKLDNFGGFRGFWLDGPLYRSVFLKAKMSPILVVIFKVGFQDSFQVAFIKNYHVVETISPY